MPSSVRSSTPRLAYVRANSSTSIQIDQEVTVVTSAADGSDKGAACSITPMISEGSGNRNDRAQTSHLPNASAASAPTLNRWNSISRLSDRYVYGRPQSSEDVAMFENNRDGVRALSEFLRRAEPPPSNYMSRPESDAGSLHSMKRSAFKIFGRGKTKKATSGPKLMQLPDSAVAAKTISGARHIAISIPLEHDYASYYDRPPSSSAPPRPHSQHSQRQISDRGAVTVLKPVAEVRESISSFLAKGNEGQARSDKRHSAAESAVTPAVELLGPETTRTLENYYTELNRQQNSRPKSSKAEGKLPVKSDSKRAQKSYVAVPPADIVRHDSTRSNPRNSAGTSYSVASINTFPAHSRGVSSASSAPTVISGLKVELPLRKSSITKVPQSIETELAKAYTTNKALPNEEPARSSFLSEKSGLSASNSTTTSGTTKSHSPPTVFGTAETAQSYNAAAGIQTISRSNTPKSLHAASPAPGIIRSNTPKSIHSATPAPTRKLPDVPESPCIPSFLPSPSPPIIRQRSPPAREINDPILEDKDRSPRKEIPNESNRKDRVKARKQRDMAIHTDNSTQQKTPSAETASADAKTAALPPRSTKRRSKSQEALMVRKRALNSVTDIKVIADLPPFTGLVTLQDLPFAPPDRAVKKGRDSDSNGNANTRRTHTPPSSFASESETSLLDRSLIRSRDSAANSILDARRQERRLKRNLTLREREKAIDARLEKVERDNAILLSTLGGIASSFGELSRALPMNNMALGQDSRHLTNVDNESVEARDEEVVHGELSRLDPIMRDLRFEAGKVSQESLKTSEGLVDSHD